MSSDTATALDTGLAGPPGRPALTVRGLQVRFESPTGPVRAVRDVDLDIARGEVVAVLGESGSGKSVTARAVMGLSAPGAAVRADVMSLGEVDLRSSSSRQLRTLRGNRISLVFQDALSALNPVLSIGDQIGDLLRAHTDLDRKGRRRRAVELLAMVGIPGPAERVGDYPHQFSGGMRQRILVAMAVALEPEVLIADEPTTALDVTVQAQVLDLIDRLRRELDMGVLLITHDLGVVSEVADRVTVMYAGRIVEAGAADEVLLGPAHPYTRALLDSAPDRAGSIGDLRVIPGTPPAPGRLPTGCPFHPRCSWAVERCRTEEPERLPVAAGWTSACHRSQDVIA